VLECADDLASELDSVVITPTPSATYLPPELTSSRVDSVLERHSEHSTSYSGVHSAVGRIPSHHSDGAASATLPVMFPRPMSAKPQAFPTGNMQTLPKLELTEPTLSVSIIDVQLPWLFWVQKKSKSLLLEDIMDRLE